jgi:ribosomal 30S subunit maturation factor RimM
MSSRSSKKTTTDQTVEVGRVHAAHGVRGEVSVEPYSEVEGRFAPGAEVLARRRDLGVEPLTVEAVRPHKARLLIRFAGVTDRDAAEALRAFSRSRCTTTTLSACGTISSSLSLTLVSNPL